MQQEWHQKRSAKSAVLQLLSNLFFISYVLHCQLNLDKANPF